MYINSKLQTCNIQIPGSVPLTDELAKKLAQYKGCAKAITDESGNVIDIEYDEEKSAIVEENKQELKIAKIRKERKKYLNAFDIYKSNLLYFNSEESDEEHMEIEEWYNTLLDITEDVAAGESQEFPEVPLKIQQYL